MRPADNDDAMRALTMLARRCYLGTAAQEPAAPTTSLIEEILCEKTPTTIVVSLKLRNIFVQFQIEFSERAGKLVQSVIQNLAVVSKMRRFICTRVNCIFVDHFSSPPRPFLVRHNACRTHTYTQIKTDVSNNSYGKSIKLHRRKCDFMVRLLNAEKQMMSGSTTGPPLNW
ncbi:hypothetical protein QTP88_017769 [Uroleucon formosanum]